MAIKYVSTEESPLISYVSSAEHGNNNDRSHHHYNDDEEGTTKKQAREAYPSSDASSSTTSSTSSSSYSYSSFQRRRSRKVTKRFHGDDDDDATLLLNLGHHWKCILFACALVCMALTCLMVRHMLYNYNNNYPNNNTHIRGHDGNGSGSSSTTIPNTYSDMSKSEKKERQQQQRIAEEALQKNLNHDSNNEDTDHNNNVPSQCLAAIVIIRHCEKGNVKEHCNKIGFQRAEYIATLFGGDDDDDKYNHDDDDMYDMYDDNGDDTIIHKHHAPSWPAPSYLFATNPGQRKDPHVRNYREIETIRPLSDKINIPINSQYGMKNTDELTNALYDLLRDGSLCGKVALISWKHEDIPRLARSLGCGPEDGCPLDWDGEDYDSTWQLIYSYRTHQYPDDSLDQVSLSQIQDQEQAQQPKLSSSLSLESLSSWRQHQKPKWRLAARIEMEKFDPLAFGNGKIYNKKHHSDNGEHDHGHGHVRRKN